MKRRIASMLLTSALIAVIGSNTGIVSNIITRNSITSKNMTEYKQVQSIKVITAISNSVEVHHIKTQKDYNKLTPIIENRNGRIVIEMIDCLVLDDNGNGSDQFGFYVKYDSRRFSKGDKVRSIFMYNSDTNYFDDIVCRTDSLIK